MDKQTPGRPAGENYCSACSFVHLELLCLSWSQVSFSNLLLNNSSCGYVFDFSWHTWFFFEFLSLLLYDPTPSIDWMQWIEKQESIVFYGGPFVYVLLWLENIVNISIQHVASGITGAQLPWMKSLRHWVECAEKIIINWTVSVARYTQISKLKLKSCVFLSKLNKPWITINCATCCFSALNYLEPFLERWRNVAVTWPDNPNICKLNRPPTLLLMDWCLHESPYWVTNLARRAFPAVGQY